MSRIVVGLVQAQICPRPTGLPISRARGKKAAGLRYERVLAAAIPGAKHGQWFRFVDRNGPGHCQTDLLLETPLAVVVLEAKYTWTETGHQQIERLYRPVVGMALDKPCFGLVVCKALTSGVNREWVCRDLDSALYRAGRGYKTVLHWIGVGLGPLQRSGSAIPLAGCRANL